MASSKDRTAKGSTDTYASVWDALADTPEQAANLWVRSELMRQIAAVVKDGGWTQVDAATRCGTTQPRINDLLRGRVSRFSIDALVNIATALGRKVHFEPQAAQKDHGEGRLVRKTGGDSCRHHLSLPIGNAPSIVPGSLLQVGSVGSLPVSLEISPAGGRRAP